MDYSPLWNSARLALGVEPRFSLTSSEVADLLGADHISMKELCADVPRNQKHVGDTARYEFVNQRKWTVHFWSE